VKKCVHLEVLFRLRTVTGAAGSILNKQCSVEVHKDGILRARFLLYMAVKRRHAHVTLGAGTGCWLFFEYVPRSTAIRRPKSCDIISTLENLEIVVRYVWICRYAQTPLKFYTVAL
jgi:hypothetical protein